MMWCSLSMRRTCPSHGCFKLCVILIFKNEPSMVEYKEPHRSPKALGRNSRMCSSVACASAHSETSFYCTVWVWLSTDWRHPIVVKTQKRKEDTDGKRKGMSTDFCLQMLTRGVVRYKNRSRRYSSLKHSSSILDCILRQGAISKTSFFYPC